jgi:hypothetical protein
MARRMKIDAPTFCQCYPKPLRRPWPGERIAANNSFILVSMKDPIPPQELRSRQALGIGHQGAIISVGRVSQLVNNPVK